jgi:hypothetical protein
MPYSIYTLSHPRNGNIFYVGMTLNLSKRLRLHKLEAVKAYASRKKKITDKDEYILANRIEPVCHVIESVYGNVYAAMHRENFWISFLKINGYPIVNKKNSDFLLGCELELLPEMFSPMEVSINTGFAVNHSEKLNQIETSIA